MSVQDISAKRTKAKRTFLSADVGYLDEGVSRVEALKEGGEGRFASDATVLRAEKGSIEE